MALFTRENTKKSYISTKNNQILCFNVTYVLILLKEDNSDIEDFQINVAIEWTCLRNGYLIESGHHHNTTIKFKVNKYTNIFSVDDFILPFKNLGVGSVVLKEVFLMAKLYIPDVKVHFSLSIQDEKENKSKDWEDRRNHFYEKFGLILSTDKKSYSAPLRSVITNIKLDYVKEVDIFELMSNLNNCETKKNSLLESNKAQSEYINTCYVQKDKCSKVSTYLAVGLFAAIISILILV